MQKTYSKEHKSKLLAALKQIGALPRKDVAKKLNGKGIKTAKGLAWTADRLKSFFADYQDIRAKFSKQVKPAKVAKKTKKH